MTTIPTALDRLCESLKLIDFNRSVSTEYIHVNSSDFKEIYEHVLTGIHAIWIFKIVEISDKRIELSYLGSSIIINDNLKGAY